MDLQDYLREFDPEARAAFAVKVGTTLGHLNNVAYKQRKASAALAMQIEIGSGGKVPRQTLRPDDYWLIWQDLPHQTVDAGIVTHQVVDVSHPVCESPGPIHMFGPDDARERRAAPATARLQHEIDTIVRPVSRLLPADRPSNHRERKG